MSSKLTLIKWVILLVTKTNAITIVIVFLRTMASNNFSISDEESEDQATCYICMHTFDEKEHKPKFFSCHHTFCLTCSKVSFSFILFIFIISNNKFPFVFGWQDLVSRSAMRGQITCSKCNSVCILPTQGAELLSKNNYALNNIKIKHQIKNMAIDQQ